MAAEPAPPDLPRRLEPVVLTVEELEDELYGVVIEQVELPDEPLRRVSISAARFDGADLSGAQLPALKLADCAFSSASIANVVARAATFNRVTIEGGRLTGLHLVEARLSDVVLRDCRADLASFYGATLQRVTFERCVLRDADFRSASMRDVVLVDCDIAGAEVFGAEFEDCELRSTALDGVTGIAQLQGIAMPWADVVASAGAFAAVLGVRVLDDG